MPIQQALQAFTPNEVAQLTGIAAHNVRRWSEYHSNHLSPLANPPTGQARHYTGRDIEVLKHIDSLRKLGLTVPVINEQLVGLTFAVIDTDAIAATSTALPTAPDAPDRASASLVALDAINTLQRRVESLERSKEPSFTVGLGVGFIAALVFVVLLLLLFLLRHYL
jgi:DNA-binding transcriptional MerR regulator